MRYGSHSAPLRISTSTGFFGASLTNAGNVAPPMPTMPASLTAASSSSLLIACQLRPIGRPSAHASSPSLSMTIAPFSNFLTLPETDAWMSAWRNASVVAIFWPRFTISPIFTHGLHGAPMCCESGIVTTSGAGIVSMGAPLASSLPSCGWMPPKNRWNINITPVSEFQRETVPRRMLFYPVLYSTYEQELLLFLLFENFIHDKFLLSTSPPLHIRK